MQMVEKDNLDQDIKVTVTVEHPYGTDTFCGISALISLTKDFKGDSFSFESVLVGQTTKGLLMSSIESILTTVLTRLISEGTPIELVQMATDEVVNKAMANATTNVSLDIGLKD